MQMKLNFISLFLVLALAACGTPTAYQSAQDGYGFSEKKLEDEHYRVEFRGNSLTDREVVETYLLYRAAELTLESGNDYFVVVEQDVDKETSYIATHDYPFGGPFYYRYYPYYWYFDDPYGRDYEPSEKFTAVADIFVGKGPKPADNPSAYDARSVIKHLEGDIKRPEAGK
jgi:hypothetical protein